MSERSVVTINTPFGALETTYGPVMCCATTARVNDIGEKVCLSMETQK